MVTEETKKEIANNEKAEKRHKELSEINDAIYAKPTDRKVITREIVTSNGNTKIKYIEVRKFSNGVTKNKLIGMSKDGKMIFGVKE